MSIYCSNMKCKYNNDKYKCTKKSIRLTFVGINTLNEGFQEYLECKSYKESDLSKEITEFLNNLEEE